MSAPLEPPIRDEIFSAERLEDYAVFLARELAVTHDRRPSRSLLPRMEENYLQLVAAYKRLTDSVSKNHPVSPAAEWLIDNFHIVEDQIREIREDLPLGFYRELPKVAKGELAGYPRVYAMALALVAHLDSFLDVDTIKRFIVKFQSVHALQCGEIWAVPIALRLALVENLRRLANQTVLTQEVKERADVVADQLLETAEHSADDLRMKIAEIPKMLGHAEIADCAFISQLSKRLRDQSPELMAACDCMESHLAGSGQTTEAVVHIAHQLEASAQLSTGNVINSMRLLSNVNWKEFFESVNPLDPILGSDPARSYHSMDFASRDRYRHTIERIAKRTRSRETDVARAALEMAEAARDADPRQSHVGSYLVTPGVLKLERKFKYRPTLKEFAQRKIQTHPGTLYFGVLLIIIAAFLAPALLYAHWLGAGPWLLALIAVTALTPVSDSAFSLLNLIIARLVAPVVLPKLDLESGIPENARTFVVVPTMLTNRKWVTRMIEGLEVRYLANQDPNLYFALLSDFTDGAAAAMPGDVELLEFARRQVAELNRRYKAPDGLDRFYLFHRKRCWNESEARWIGWERKRGKLHEFNRFLRGARDTTFIISPEYSEFFNSFRFVITLDSDTQLPRDSARRLIGTILHPFNQPRFDPAGGRVTAGYGILQPRISITPASSGRSWFAKIFSGNTGIDPYTTAVSDVYQDLFGEGIYTGKGLYVIDAFEAALAGRVPENSLLSHDLFEGLFARTALVTDIEFLDDYPSHYEAFAKRQHRWTRGDWQLLQWLRGRQLGHLPFISRWKIIDNLRRSLIALSTLIWLVLGWTVLPGAPVVWTVATIIVLSIPALAHTTNQFFLHPRGIPWTSHFWTVWGDSRLRAAQMALSIVCLVHQAYLQTDAILRAVYRCFVSRRQLLQWEVAAEVESSVARQRGVSAQILWPSLLAAAAVFLTLLWLEGAEALWPALLFIIAWASFPAVVARISRPRPVAAVNLTSADERLCRHLARRTWNFFETFAGPEDHWLPPDNFQETPAPMVAHRTSPTNMGMLLLSTCSAHDLGYLNTAVLIKRLGLTLDTLASLEKRFGHFFNWYDTKSLKPLWPEYISTVDSGNLAGHLIAVKQACLEIPEHEILSPRLKTGLIDTAEILTEKLTGPAREAVNQMLFLAENVPADSISAWNALFGQLSGRIEALTASLDESGDGDSAREWLKALARMVDSHREFIGALAPWTRDDSQNLTPNQPLVQSLDRIRPLKVWIQDLVKAAEDLDPAENGAAEWRNRLSAAAENGRRLVQRANQLAWDCHKLMMNMDFAFLFDKQRKVFPIGFNVHSGAKDNSFYDLLASEARLTSFIAIVKGDVPQNHWFHLGRQMTSLYNERLLISWSASMFEYLMPLLVMRDHPATILSETYRSVVKIQVDHGRRLGIPWGISESGYNSRDLQMNYQYGPFGVPGLGLKRGLSDDQVVSPYSTALAAMVFPAEAVANMRRFISDGLLTDFGFYEAIDYTSNRLPPGQSAAVIRNYLAHHQGMILTSLANVLLNGIFQRRFHRDPAVQSSELLLQERIPVRVALSHPRAEEVQSEKLGFYKTQTPFRQIKSASTVVPRVQILSNGQYSVMISAAGSGFSRSGQIAVTRWHNDPTRDHSGSFFYIRDHLTEKTWSATLQPMPPAPDTYRVTFSEHKAEFWRQDGDIVTHTEVIVSARENVELRRLTFTNLSGYRRELDVVSYLEPVLTTPEADLAHPAFSNLFIQTEFIQARSALLAHRRKRSAHEPEYWGLHALAHVEGGGDYRVEYETSRKRFLGRNRSPSAPEALAGGAALSNFAGLALDPALALKTKVAVEPYGTMHVCFVTGLAHSRDEALGLIDQFHDANAFRREDEMTWTRAQVEARHLGLSSEDANLYQDLAGGLLFPCGPLRAASHVMDLNSKPLTGLWPFGISGDLPILLAEINSDREIPTIRKLLHAHEYLRLKGLKWDLVFLCSEATDYRQVLFEETMRQIRISTSGSLLNKPGGVFVVRKDSVSAADAVLLSSAARVYLHSDRGTLTEQISRIRRRVERPIDMFATPSVPLKSWRSIPLQVPKLEFFNGLGGFTADGREYVIHLKDGKSTPLPWINVIANEIGFGCLVSESGAGFTWARNSRENRLTPWSNDPVLDPSGEALYILDNQTGNVWSPTPGPARDPEPYLIRHGQGYTVFEHITQEMSQELTVSVAPDAEVKISRLRLKNLSSDPRDLAVTLYLEWVLGFHRGQTGHGVITTTGLTSNIHLARNPLNSDFGERIAFAAVNRPVTKFTCDRREFLGRHGDYRRPAGLAHREWSKKIGPGLDSCSAMQVNVKLLPQEEAEIIFLLGQASNAGEAQDLVARFSDPVQATQAISATEAQWEKMTGALEIKTPFPQLDLMANRWLIYQTLSCRLWARSATYQSSGAFGFRDQLQDVMALVHCRPDLVREQILKAAAHQFPEGDVLHWWHPPSDRGVRTHFSDDLLWLPLVVHHYVEATGDASVLDEQVPYIEGPMPPREQEDIYFQPHVSQYIGSIYDHCVRAIDRSLSLGRHGLPLMGSGDWNDGMNRVGHQGRGESVWMAWFLGLVLKSFAPLCWARGDHERSTLYGDHIDRLKDAVATTGWDGQWYRRAYFDDGTPLGSSQNEECRIDSIAQSWAAISGLGDPGQVRLALNAADHHLVRRKEKLILLFTPPFDKTDLDPGYIKGYIPGIRENGAQYTHAAVWLAMAFARMGDGDRALELALLLNPINHAESMESALVYQVEPYVVPADIYSVEPQTGRGGWTWYTGSASWYYRAITESLLGLHRRGPTMDLNPVLTANLRRFEVRYRFGSSTYEFHFENRDGATQGRLSLTLDGNSLAGASVPLIDDGKSHRVDIQVKADDSLVVMDQSIKTSPK